MYSIIVPIFSLYKAYIPECIRSIASQTFTDFECLLIVNDFLSELDDYTKDKHFKIIYSNSVNQSCKRNVGIKNAKGDKLVFVDCDDVINATFLEVGEKVQSDLVLFGFTKDYSKITPTYNNLCVLKLNNITEYFYDDCFELNNKHNSILVDSVCSKIFIKDIIIKNNIFFDENTSCAEDSLFVKDYVNCCANYALVPDYISYYWRVHSMSTMQTIGPFYDLNYFYIHLLKTVKNASYDNSQLINDYIFHNIQLRFSKMIWLLKNNSTTKSQLFLYIKKHYYKGCPINSFLILNKKKILALSEKRVKYILYFLSKESYFLIKLLIFI